MNSRQQQQYERSLEIAKRDGLKVYAVPSWSQADVWHLVVVEGRTLVCDCEAAKHGRYCAHRAAVREEMEAEAEHEREVEEAFHAAARALNVKLETVLVSPALTAAPSPATTRGCSASTSKAAKGRRNVPPALFSTHCRPFAASPDTISARRLRRGGTIVQG